MRPSCIFLEFFYKKLKSLFNVRLIRNKKSRLLQDGLRQFCTKIRQGFGLRKNDTFVTVPTFQTKDFKMVGIDIIEIERIKKNIQKFGNTFLNKIFTQNEQMYCNQYRFKEERYAGRFAAKEAVAKVIQKGPKDFWLDIEILQGENGIPVLNLSPRLKPYILGSIDISISHEKRYAVAIAQCILSS
jgi:holo-[acyl-carrier protein] synthase